MSDDGKSIEAGLTVGRFKIARKLGAGAMGEVYLGTDDGLGRQAALKFLGLSQIGNATVRERFLREARALARLNHPNLITVYEASELHGRPWFAMELLEGGDTMQLLAERGPLPSGVVARIGSQAALGLAEAARAGIIHRDVKPSNLGISGRGVVKVTDFGLAKSQSIEKGLTAKGLVVGTADYIAPEQARGETLDERADVYSLAGTLFHLLTGHPPYRRDLTAVIRYMDVIRDHLTAPIPRLAQFAADVDPDLADIVYRGMAKERQNRPLMTEMATGLDRIAQRLGGALPRVSARSFAATSEGTTFDDLPPPDTRAREAPDSRKPGPAAAAKAPRTASPRGGVARRPDASPIDASASDVNAAAADAAASALRRRNPWTALTLGLAMILIAAAGYILYSRLGH